MGEADHLLQDVSVLLQFCARQGAGISVLQLVLQVDLLAVVSFAPSVLQPAEALVSEPEAGHAASVAPPSVSEVLLPSF